MHERTKRRYTDIETAQLDLKVQNSRLEHEHEATGTILNLTWMIFIRDNF